MPENDPVDPRGPSVAVLIPCYNEAATISAVVAAFRNALPEARIYVYDNNSTDETAALATEAGAVVRKETLQGKGNVVRRMFADVDADVCLLVDGDGTYDASAARPMVDLLWNNMLDMVSARRVTDADAAYPIGHKFGNRFLTGVVAAIFGARFKDMLSGYRAFSRRFVKSFPAMTQEFEIETELTVHALELGMPVAEIDVPYGARPDGSESKLRTLRDGWKIALTILYLVKEERPLQFFSATGLALVVAASVVAAPLLPTYLATGEVPRFPTAILATGLSLLGFLSFFNGLVLDTVTHGRREVKRLHYLQQPCRT